MYLGNIVSEIDVKKSDLLFKTDKLEDTISEIPTLIIGWDFAKRLFPDTKLSILERKIDENIYWTFTKKERRVDYEADYESFITRFFKTVDKKTEYKYVNILTAKQSEVKILIQKLISKQIFHIYIRFNSFVYAYCDGIVYGFDLNAIDFIKIDRKKIYRILYSKGNKIYFNDEIIPKEFKKYNTQNNKIVPYLIKIIEEKK